MGPGSAGEPVRGGGFGGWYGLHWQGLNARLCPCWLGSLLIQDLLSVCIPGRCLAAHTIVGIGNAPLGWMDLGQVTSPGRDSSPTPPPNPPAQLLPADLTLLWDQGQSIRILSTPSFGSYPWDCAGPRAPVAALRRFYLGPVCMQFSSCLLDSRSAERAVPPWAGTLCPTPHSP